MKHSLLAISGILFSCGLLSADSRTGIDSVGKVADRPDTQLSRPMNREPTKAEIARLEGTVNCSPQAVLRRFGHPSRVKEAHHHGGTETWIYSWGDPKKPSERVGIVYIQFGKVVEAGYMEEERQTGFNVPPGFFNQ